MIGHAPAREEAGGNGNVGAAESDWSCAQWGNYGRRRSSLSASLAQFWQSIPFKMAYHSPYKAPPHINAPPDQGFLWNIFQRWVGGGRRVVSLLSACLSLRSAPQWKLLSIVARRGREWGWAGGDTECFTDSSSFCLHSRALLTIIGWQQWN